MPKLIQRLPDGPLDIIGDVHGEFGALQTLLVRLGCDLKAGTAQRPLVFIGDLVDRGPDSVAVCQLVMRLCKLGVAQCIIGNHELNVLKGEKKEGNGWIMGGDDRFEVGGVKHTFDSVACDPDTRVKLLDWMKTLPLALTRDDLRVVHAAWDHRSIESLPEQGEVAKICNDADKRVGKSLSASGVVEGARKERDEFDKLKNHENRPTRLLPNHTALAVAEQVDNPVRALTSGLEEAVPTLDGYKFLGGKWRTAARSEWWNRYEDDVAVVVGHYWRKRTKPEGSAPWHANGPFGWVGPKRNVFCVDFSVGRRYLERASGTTEGFAGALAALRWPEKTLVFDDRVGSVATT